MGGGLSTSSTGTGTIEEQAAALYPPYLIRDAVVTAEDISAAKSAWNAIIEDESVKYLELRDAGQIMASTSCLAWFYDTFYQISEERDKSSMALYGTGMKAQVKALVGMVSMSLNLFKTNDIEKVKQTLDKVAKGHVVHIGVRAYQFPIVGEILLHALEKVLGSQFDEATKLAWTKIISAVMVIMIPAVLREESLLSEEHKKEQCEKVQAHMAAVEDQTFRKLVHVNESVRVSGGGSESTATVESTAESDPPSTVIPQLASVAEVPASIESEEIKSARVSQSMKQAVVESEGQS